MKTEISPAFLKPYFTEKKKHIAYTKTVEIMNRLKCHANGEHPSYQTSTTEDGNQTMTNVITEKRPHEQPESKAYRSKIFVPITKATVSKVFSSLLKIRKAHGWAIKYDKNTVSKKLQEGETMQDYCESNYPYFGSITNWMFNVGIKHYGIDPNGVNAVIPIELEIEDGTFYRPFVFTFDSNQVYDYQQDDYAILLSTDKSHYTENGHEFKEGKVFWVITTVTIQRWEQINGKGDMKITKEYKHNIGELPVRKNRGVFYSAMDKIFIWESRLDPIVPRLTEAAREYSDLQLEVTFHMHSESWTWASQECVECDGTGKVKKGTHSVKCTAKGCNGGRLTNSPFNSIVVKPPMAGEVAAPIPPKGYIIKPTDIVKIQNERVQDHLFQALSAINMEWLVQTPMNQSGKAKEVDRDELNNFVSGIAEDIISIMDWAYYFTGEMRNKVRIPSKEERLKQLPEIPVPDKFDLISVETSIDMLIKGKPYLSPILNASLEIDYANKQFNAEPEIKRHLEVYFSLDPIPGKSEADKAQMLNAGGVTQIDYIMSCNLERFIQKAMNDNEGFIDFTLDKQIPIIQKYATEKLKELSAKESTMKIVDGKAKNKNDDKEDDKAA